MQHDQITAAIVAVGIEIHCRLGTGLFESVYRKVPANELPQRGLDRSGGTANPARLGFLVPWNSCK